MNGWGLPPIRVLLLSRSKSCRAIVILAVAARSIWRGLGGATLVENVWAKCPGSGFTFVTTPWEVLVGLAGMVPVAKALSSTSVFSAA